MPLSLDFGNIFILIPLDISDIKVKEKSDINESKNFNADIQTYLAPEGEYKEFIVIGVNLNIIRNNSEEYLYNKNDLYLKFNNAGYNDITQMNYIYNYCILYL